MKLIKWLLWGVLFVVVVAVSGAIFLVNKVDPNDYKPQITNQVESQIGRKLAINGDLSWRFYPWIGITLNDFELSNRAGFLPSSMLAGEQADIQLKLIPLLSKQLEIGKITLLAPKVNLSVNKQGDSNWADLAGDANTGSGASEPSPEQAAGAIAGGLVIQGVNITDGAIDWNDEASGQRYQLIDFNLTTGTVEPGKPVDFDLSTSLASNLLPEPTQIAIKGNVLLNEAYDMLDIEPISADIEMGSSSANLDIGKIHFDVNSGNFDISALGGEVSMDQLRSNLLVEGIKFSVNNNKLEAVKLSIEGQADQFPFKGEIGALAYDLNANSLGIKNQKINSELNKLPVELVADTVTVSLDEESVVLPTFNLQAGDARIEGGLNIANLFSEISANGHIKSNNFNVRAVLDQLGFNPLADLPENALQNIAIDTAFDASLSSIAMRELVAKFDKTTITGSFTMKDFATLASRFDLQIDQLNVDEYLSEDNAEVAKEVGPGAAVALPFTALQGLDVKGTAVVGELKIQDLLSNDVKLSIDTATNQIKISPLRAKLYGGETLNTLVYDVSGNVPSVEIDTKLTAINLGSFLNAMQMTDRIEGFGNISSNVSASGLDADEMIANLNGQMNIALKDGQITGVSIQKTLLKVAQVYNQLKGKDLDYAAELGDKTEFSDFVSDIKIENGVLRTQNIDLKAPGFRLTGDGLVDLNSNVLDMSLVVAVVKTFEGQGGQALGNLKGESVPVKVTGTLAAPKIVPDISKILKRQLQRKLSEKYLGGKVSGESFDESLKEKLNSKLAEKLGLEPNTPDTAEQATQPAPSNSETNTIEVEPIEQDQEVPEKAPKSQEEILKEKFEKEKERLKKKLFGKLLGG